MPWLRRAKQWSVVETVLTALTWTGARVAERKCANTHIKKDCTILVQPLGQGHEQEHAGARPVRTCTPFKIQSILRHICDQDTSFLGLSPQYSHPRNMMWSVLYIPPPIIRPGRTDRDQQPNARSENDLTKRLKSIVRCTSH
jgi:DNA-directed RNA polymerase beta' subunit